MVVTAVTSSVDSGDIVLRFSKDAVAVTVVTSSVDSEFAPVVDAHNMQQVCRRL